MNLDIFNDLIDKLKESDLVQNFIEELSNHLENSKEKEKNNIMNINSIEEKYKLNSEYANKLKIERNKILEEQARNFNNDESLYYVSYKNSFNNNYQIIEFNKINENKSFYITGEELPKNISVGKVMRKIDDKYEIDNDITKQIMKKVEDCAEVLANEQNEELKKYRQEGAIYQVVDHSSKGVFLQNKDNNVIFEETNLSEELMDKISNDYILSYKNGEYVYEEELTDDFFQNYK